MGSRIRDHRLPDAARPGAPLSGRQESLPSGFIRVFALFRLALRLLVVLVSLADFAARWLFLWLRGRCRPGPDDRARWLQGCCASLLRRLRIGFDSRGPRPLDGLVCSNHLSYFDIAVYAAIMPCVFVSKIEVRRWPAFGFLARAGGTLFIDRSSRASTDAVAQQIADTLRTGIPVLLFPEGTSTDGSSVLRFHSSLLEPAVQSQTPITAAAIAWRARNASEQSISWYGDAAFLSHLTRVLAYSGVKATVEFHPNRTAYPDRKAAALELREKVAAMRNQMKSEEAT